MARKPLAVDLYCGLGGWTEGLLAEGYFVVGFDIERHEYGEHRYPAQLVLQDVLTIHGSQFKDAALIVASPPCQAYSYRAMPWKRAKALPPPDNTLFETCFRIQREACEAAGRHIPLIVENVRGAQKWVGRARWNYGSYYLWGDVPALMPIALRAQKFNPDGTNHAQGSWFAIANSKNRGARSGLKNPGFRFDGSGGSFQSESVNRHTPDEGYKSSGMNWSDQTKRGQDFTRIAGQQCAGRKSQDGGTWFGDYAAMKECGIKQRGSGREWFAGDGKISRLTSSGSPARKFASAMIAKIPLTLSRHIAATFKTDNPDG